MKNGKMLRRLWAVVLTLAMSLALIPNIAAKQVEAAGFSPRLTAPSTSDACYYGLNPYTGDNALPNCTCYAYGRAYEILGYQPDINTWGNAYTWWQNNIDKRNNGGGYPYGQTPALGAIVVWDGGDGFGHVGVVEAIDGGTVTVSQSAYDEWKSTASSNYFYLTTFTGVSSAADMGYQGSVWRNCLGFIYVYDGGPDPIPWEILNLGDSFTAQIKHDDWGWLVKDNGGSLQCVSGSTSDKNSWWEFTRNSNGTYRIKNCETGKYIDDYGAGASSGNAINTWEGNGSAAQNWYLRRTPNGKVLFEVECAQSMTMDMGGDAVTNGADVHLWVFSDDNTNQWYTLVYDKANPTISNVTISDITTKGYKVECDVSDDIGIAKVEMPTWTSKDGQDDLASVWPKATVSNGHATYYVSVADHNNECGVYFTHIYVFDYSGKRTMVDAKVGGVEVPDPTCSHTWDSGKVTKAATCTEDGEKTYTCTKCKQTKVVLIEAKGHKLDNGTVTEAPTRFTNGVRTFACENEGCDYTTTESISPDDINWVTGINLNVTSLSLNVGNSSTITVSTAPADAVSTDIIWTSSDADVAAVDANGKVTAVGEGEAVITASAADSFPPTTEYRYRDFVEYETKTTTTKGSLGEDWEYVSEKTDTTYGAYGDWSSWSDNAPNPGASDTRKVETRSVVASYKTQYNYSKYAQYSDGTGWSGPSAGYWSGIYCGYCIERGWSDSALSAYSSDGSIVLYGRSGDTWYNQTTQSVPASYKTQYRYCDRTKTVTTTYTYRRPIWSDWSTWSATPAEAKEGREIDTRDVTGAGEATVVARCSVTVALDGWQEVEGGKAYYVNGKRVVGAKTIGGKRYFFNGDGIMVTGWLDRNGKRYYFETNKTNEGVMYTGLHTIDGKKYYFTSKGVMKTGFFTANGKTFYFGTDGVMATGKKVIDGKTYLFTSKGVMKIGFFTSNGKTYYFGTDGAMATGKTVIDGKTYYFSKKGVMTTGWLTVKGKTFYFNSDGTMQKGWKKINGQFYRFNNNGVMITGWTKYKDNWYYLKDDGTMMKNGSLTIGPSTFYFDKNGVCTNLNQ